MVGQSLLRLQPPRIGGVLQDTIANAILLLLLLLRVVLIVLWIIRVTLQIRREMKLKK